MVQWRGRRQSGNVEDRRGMRPGGLAVGGGIGTVLVVLAISLLTGTDPRDVVQVIQPGGGQAQPTGSPINDEASQFVRVIVADTEDTWTQLLPQLGRQYEPPVLVLFSALCFAAGVWREPRDRMNGAVPAESAAAIARVGGGVIWCGLGRLGRSPHPAAYNGPGHGSLWSGGGHVRDGAQSRS